MMYATAQGSCRGGSSNLNTVLYLWHGVCARGWGVEGVGVGAGLEEGTA